MNRAIPLILAVALFMEQMDSTVIATALPAIANDLHVEPITLKLALTSYMVALATFIPVSGWMADKFGAKRIFRAAIVVFLIGSIACAFSGNLLAFVVSRFLQGMGGAMMTPVGRLVLLRTTKRSDLVSAMALLTIPALIGPLTGPPVGGFLTTYLSWHWIFWINIPFGIAGIIVSGLLLPEIATRETPALDVVGFLLIAIATSGVVFGLSVISLPALPTAIGVVATIAGLASGVAYIFHAKRHPAPMLDLKLLDNAVFRAAASSGTIFRISTGAVPFLMPLMLQLGFGLNPFQSGMITFAGAVGAIMTKFMAKRVYAAAGFKTTLIAAAITASIATAANGLFTASTPYAVLFTFLLMTGFSRSFFFTGNNAMSYSEIDDDQASQATSIASVLQQVSLALGVAVAAMILETATYLRGEALSVADFHLAFLLISCWSLCAIIPILRLPGDAGASVSGHRRAAAGE